MEATLDYRRIGILTSGGDAPGMNALIRAVAYSAAHKGWDVMGVRSGFAGLVGGDFVPIKLRGLSGIIQQGGTILKSARFPQFTELLGRCGREDNSNPASRSKEYETDSRSRTDELAFSADVLAAALDGMPTCWDLVKAAQKWNELHI